MNRLLNILLGTAGALGAIIAYDALTYDGRLPIERWVGVTVVNSPIRAGQDLIVVIERVKVRDDCTVASSRQIINEDGIPFDLPASVSAGGLSGKESVRFSYPIPRTTPAGNYTLNVYLTYNCPEFVWTTQQPEARFRILGD